MKLLKKLTKSFSLFLILSVMSALFCGFTASGSTEIGHNGKGTMTLTVESSLPETEFRETLGARIRDYNVLSGDSDMLVVKSVRAGEGGYTVAVAFRRIDKIKLNGDFYWQSFSSSVAEGSEFRSLLEKLAGGNISCTVSAYYDGYLGQITVPRSSELTVAPFDAAGNELGLERLFGAGSGAPDRSTMFLFRIFDVKNVTKVTVTLPGKIVYCGGSGVKIISGDTAELTPEIVRASVLKNKVITDENGTEKIEPEISVEDVTAFLGYIVFEKSMSPFAAGVIVAAVVIVVGLCVAVYVGFYRSGKRILRAEEASAKEGEGDGKDNG